VTEDEINSILTELDVSEFDEIDFIRIALKHYGGVLATRQIFDNENPNIGYNDLRAMRDKIAKKGEISYDGETYLIERYKSGYKLEHANMQTCTDENDMLNVHNPLHNGLHHGELSL
jgi:hypothetical protein